MVAIAFLDLLAVEWELAKCKPKICTSTDVRSTVAKTAALEYHVIKIMGGQTAPEEAEQYLELFVIVSAVGERRSHNPRFQFAAVIRRFLFSMLMVAIAFLGLLAVEWELAKCKPKICTTTDFRSTVA